MFDMIQFNGDWLKLPSRSESPKMWNLKRKDDKIFTLVKVPKEVERFINIRTVADFDIRLNEVLQK